MRELQLLRTLLGRQCVRWGSNMSPPCVSWSVLSRVSPSTTQHLAPAFFCYSAPCPCCLSCSVLCSVLSQMSKLPGVLFLLSQVLSGMLLAARRHLIEVRPRVFRMGARSHRACTYSNSERTQYSCAWNTDGRHDHHIFDTVSNQPVGDSKTNV